LGVLVGEVCGGGWWLVGVRGGWWIGFGLWLVVLSAEGWGWRGGFLVVAWGLVVVAVWGSAGLLVG